MNNLPAPAIGIYPGRAQSLGETGLEQLLSAGSTLGARLSPAQGVTDVYGTGTGVQGLGLALLGSGASGTGVVASAWFADASNLVTIRLA